MDIRDADWAVRRYEAVRPLLPGARMPAVSKPVGNLGELVGDFDVFLLDAFGVLNVGNTAIGGAADRVKSLQDMGKRVLVLTNGATFPTEQSLVKFADLGFDFQPADIVSSRNALDLSLGERPETGFWGAMAAEGSQIGNLAAPCQLLRCERDVYDAACGFVLLSTADWTDEQQALLFDSLKSRPRPVLVGNPDIVAPRENGLTLEPGFYAYDLACELNFELGFFGKPFSNIFDLAFSLLTGVDPSRVLMVGDTLHTDVLGGAAYGTRTALVTDHGLFAGRSVAPYIENTGIVPDFIMPTA